MVQIELIQKSIDESISKCSNSSSKARKRGEGAMVTYCTEGAMYKSFHTLTYPDGTVIEFHNKADVHNCDLESVTIDGKRYDFLYEKSYDTFKKQDDYLDYLFENGDFDEDGTPHNMNKYIFPRFCSSFACLDGMMLNSSLRHDDKDPTSGLDIKKSWYDMFVEFEKNNLIDDTDYVAYRVQTSLHDHDDISKKNVSDKAHTSTTVGGAKDDMKNTFVHGERDDGEYWQILTVVDKSSGVTGAFMGNAIKEADGSDWETEVNFKPKQRFERLLIDETNKIIIQKPIVK